MCCIFTCCGWVIDLIQRVWTFAMSCVISSAICCVCLTSSMSGIALGYNYSLAEYIDLKETNVSVYMKRGVFDDAVVDDNQWRRSGHLPVAGHIGEDNLMTGAPDEGEMPLRSGRRLDNSIYEADDRNRFEGSLLKLTAKPPYSSISVTGMTPDPDLEKIRSEHDRDSPEFVKAVQSLINMRKSASTRQSTYDGIQKGTNADRRYGPQFPNFPPGVGIDGRRIPSNDDPLYSTKAPSNPLREAVPRYSLMEKLNWIQPKLPPPTRSYLDYDNMVVIDDNLRPTYPPPVTVRQKPIRPTRPSTWAWPTNTARIPFATPQETARPNEKDMLVDESMDALKEKIMLDQFDAPNIKVDIPKTKDSKKPDDIYDYEARGLPVRRRRSVPISEVKNTYFSTRIQINNIHSETSSVASNVPPKNYVSTADDNNYNNNALKNHSANLMDKMLTFFYGKIYTSLSKNVKNDTNTEEKTDMTVSLYEFKSLPGEVTRKELITKILRSRFIT